MTKIKALWTKYKELILYLIFGALTTLVNFVSFWCFSQISNAPWFYMAIEPLAWFLSVCFAFVVNKLFVFESRSFQPKLLLKEVLGFFGARVSSLFIEWGGLYLLVELCGMSALAWQIFGFTLTGPLLAKVILAVPVIILNYIFSKLFIFKKEK